MIGISLNRLRCCTLSQCERLRVAVVCERFGVRVTVRATAFRNGCRLYLDGRKFVIKRNAASSRESAREVALVDAVTKSRMC